MPSCWIPNSFQQTPNSGTPALPVPLPSHFGFECMQQVPSRFCSKAFASTFYSPISVPITTYPQLAMPLPGRTISWAWLLPNRMLTLTLLAFFLHRICIMIVSMFYCFIFPFRHLPPSKAPPFIFRSPSSIIYYFLL